MWGFEDGGGKGGGEGGRGSGDVDGFVVIDRDSEVRQRSDGC